MLQARSDGDEGRTMYFVDAVDVLVKRWYVLFAAMVLVGGGVVAAFAFVPTQYQATANVLLLLPSDSTGERNPTNPYLNLQPGLITTATLIAGDLGTKAVAQQMEDAGHESSFAIGLLPDTGPLLVVTVEDSDPAAAQATRDAVVDLIVDRLDVMQADIGVPDEQRIFVRTNGSDREAEVLPGSRIRAAAGIGGVGTALAVLLTFLFDRLARRRAARK